MSLRLRERDKTPPGLFRYTQPESGKQFEAHSLDGLLARVRDHREANDYPVGLLWQEQVEEQICETLVKAGHGDWVVNVEQEFLPVAKGLKLKVATLLRGTRTLFAHIAGGRQTVPKEEAERRAAICVGCESNRKPEECISCRGGRVEAAVRELIGNGLATSHDGQLQACDLCGCFLKAKVHVPLDILQRYQDAHLNSQLPAHCWGKKV